MRLLLPFADDSTLFFATKLAALLAPLPVRPVLAHLVQGSALSGRQLAEALPRGGAIRLEGGDWPGSETVSACDAVVTSRMFQPLLDWTARVPPAGRRPVICFQGGLDFQPDKGFFHRRDADGVFVVPRADLDRLARWRLGAGLPPQPADFGHPAFLAPSGPPVPRGAAITFFAQAVSPLTRPARAHMVAVLAALARRHPDRPVRIKLRHLPGENRGHLHHERFDYPGLLARLRDRPPNLTAAAMPLEAALADTGLGLTCTSTAAADLIAARIPTLIHLDYPENYLDPLVAPMRGLFGASGLVASLPDLLAMQSAEPDPDWLAGMFCPPDLGRRLLAMVAALRPPAAPV